MSFSRAKVLEILYDARFHLELNFTQHSYQDLNGDAAARARLAEILGVELRPRRHGTGSDFVDDRGDYIAQEEVLLRVMKAIKQGSSKGDHDIAVFVETSQIVKACSVGAMQWVRALSLPTPKSGYDPESRVINDPSYLRAHWAVAWAINRDVGSPMDDDDEVYTTEFDPEEAITRYNDTHSKEVVVDKFTEAIEAIEAGQGRDIWKYFNKFYAASKAQRKKVSA